MTINKFKHLSNKDIDEYWSMSMDELSQVGNAFITEIQREGVPFQQVQDNRPLMVHMGGHKLTKRGNKVFVPRKNGGEFEIPESEIPQYWTLIYFDEYERYLELMSIYNARIYRMEGGSNYCLHIVENWRCVHCGASLQPDRYVQGNRAE